MGTNDPHARLAAEIARRDAARGKHQTASATLERAKQVAAECEQEAARLAAEEQSWIARLSHKLETWIADGNHGERPVVAADAKVMQRQLSVRANAAAASEALARFEAAERDAREGLAAADAVVAAAVDEQIAAEAEAIAVQIEEHFAQADRLGAELRLYQPDDRNTPINRLGAQRVASHRVRRVLTRLEFMGTDATVALNTPLNELPTAPAVSAAGADFLAQRRAALMSADSAQPPEPRELQEAAA